ncbi:MAG: BRCT domain-containing protein, partial [Crocinitomicaceae bacterium]
GQTVAKKLAKYFKNIDAIVAAKYDDLVSVDEIGEKIAISVQQFFLKKENLVLIERLKKAGLQFAIEEKENNSSKFEGETFVVSGVFASFSRNEIKELIEINGGKNSSSISSKTSYVVAGENMGPAKLKKATDLGVSIISESEFVKMLGENY